MIPPLLIPSSRPLTQAISSVGSVQWTPGDIIAIVVAIAGSITTITAVVIAARLTARERLKQRRQDAYLRIYEIVMQITKSATDHALFPGLQDAHDEPDRDLERKANTEMLLIGSEAARKAYDGWRTAVFSYWPLVYNAAGERLKYDRLVEAKERGEDVGEVSGQPSPIDLAFSAAEQERVKLGGPLTRIEEASRELENVLRSEIST